MATGPSGQIDGAASGAAAAPGTDDLLAQLAGDEIDRLLAESDIEPADAAAPAPVLQSAVEASAAPAVNSSAAERAKLDAPAETVPPTGASADSGAPAAASSVDAPSDVTPAISPAMAATPPAAAPAAAEQPPASSKATDAKKTEPAAAPNESVVAGAQADDRVSLVVRFLQFVNSPLDGFSDPTRDLIGKIGLMTLMNALAVLVYVMVFRRKG